LAPSNVRQQNPPPKPGQKPASKALVQPSPAESGMVPVAGHPANPFRPGNIISGKYEVIGMLGDGGMGFVVAAKHLELGEQVALKFL
jgi:hypothetical protein